MLPAPTTAYPLDFLLSDYVLLGLAAVLAGLVDAVVGGGGLIQLPALFSVLPQTLPATLFGTNKLAAIWGTAVAARAYAKRLPLDWGIAIPAAAAALIRRKGRRKTNAALASPARSSSRAGRA